MLSMYSMEVQFITQPTQNTHIYNPYVENCTLLQSFESLCTTRIKLKVVQNNVGLREKRMKKRKCNRRNNTVGVKRFTCRLIRGCLYGKAEALRRNWIRTKKEILNSKKDASH